MKCKDCKYFHVDLMQCMKHDCIMVVDKDFTCSHYVEVPEPKVKNAKQED